MRPWFQFNTRQLFAMVGACGLLAATIPYFIIGYDDLFTCALCRTRRTDYVYLDRRWRSVYAETECTKWYRDNIETVHNHVWVHGRASAFQNLCGQRFGAIDRDPPGRVIWSLTPADQVAIYSHLPNPIEGKELFLVLAARSTMANNQDFEFLRALQAWKEAGYEGAWGDASQK